MTAFYTQSNFLRLRDECVNDNYSLSLSPTPPALGSFDRSPAHSHKRINNTKLYSLLRLVVVPVFSEQNRTRKVAATHVAYVFSR